MSERPWPKKISFLSCRGTFDSDVSFSMQCATKVRYPSLPFKKVDPVLGWPKYTQIYHQYYVGYLSPFRVISKILGGSVMAPPQIYKNCQIWAKWNVSKRTTHFTKYTPPFRWPHLWPRQLPAKGRGTFCKTGGTFWVHFIKINLDDFYAFGSSSVTSTSLIRNLYFQVRKSGRTFHIAQIWQFLRIWDFTITLLPKSFC